MPEPSITSPNAAIKRKPSFPLEEQPLKKQNMGNLEFSAMTTIEVTPEIIQPASVFVDAGTQTGEVTIAPGHSSTKKRKAGDEDASSGAKKQKTNPPIKDCFTTWQPTFDIPKQAEEFWGIKPTSNDAPPEKEQPSARSSDGAVNPPLWEDLKFRFKSGSQHVSHFGHVPREVPQGAPTVNQEDLLVIKLMDMRPKSRKDPTPRRTPDIYFASHGKPKDWTDKQAIKYLNDRRAQAIDRVTLDAPWTPTERAFLASLLVAEETKDASIWKLTQLFNDHFMGNFISPTGLDCTELFTGRTVESVSHEYRTYKDSYDRGEVRGGIRNRIDKSRKGLVAKTKTTLSKFGRSDKGLEKAWDEEHGEICDTKDEDREEEDRNAVILTSAKEKKNSKEEAEAVARMAEKPKLSGEDEELLILTGAYGLTQEPAPAVQAVSDVPVESSQVNTTTTNQYEATNSSTGISYSAIPAGAKLLVEKAARDIVIDENYDDEDDRFNDLFEDDEL